MDKISLYPRSFISKYITFLYICSDLFIKTIVIVLDLHSSYIHIF